MAIDNGRASAIAADLKSKGVTPADIEKEINLRNKWGRMQNDSMRAYTTEELAAAAAKL